MFLRSIQLLSTSGLWICLRRHSYCKQTPRSQSDMQHTAWLITSFSLIPQKKLKSLIPLALNARKVKCRAVYSKLTRPGEESTQFLRGCGWWRRLGMIRKHQTHIHLQGLKPAAEARHADPKGNGCLHLRLWGKTSFTLHSQIFQPEACF